MSEARGLAYYSMNLTFDRACFAWACSLVFGMHGCQEEVGCLDKTHQPTKPNQPLVLGFWVWTGRQFR